MGAKPDLWYAPAVCVRIAKPNLRQHIPLLGGFTKPAGRLGMVSGYPLAAAVHESEVELSERVPLVGGLTKPARAASTWSGGTPRPSQYSRPNLKKSPFSPAR